MVMDVATRVPVRSLHARVFTSGGTAAGVWPQMSEDVHFSESNRNSQESVEFFLPFPLGMADMPNEAATLGTLTLGNRVDLHVASWRTLGGMSVDAAVGGGRAGNTASDFSRVVWQGTIIAIKDEPDGFRVVCSGNTPPTAGSGKLHLISRAMLLDYSLEISTYLTGLTYTGWVLIDANAYDIDAVKVGDTMRVYPARVLNLASTTRYDAYEETSRTVASIDWSLPSLRVSFDTPDRNVVSDLLTGGLTTMTTAGAPTDASVDLPRDGLILVDNTNHTLVYRSGAVMRTLTGV